MSDADGSVQRGLDPREMAAVRQLFSKLDPETQRGDELDIIQAAQRIKSEWDRREEQMNSMANTLTDLTQQVEEINAAIDNDDYSALNSNQKKLRIKRLVQNAAKENNGRGQVDYQDIRNRFDKQMPGSSALYLMEQIGEKESGYEYRERADANNILRCDLAECETRLFSSE